MDAPRGREIKEERTLGDESVGSTPSSAANERDSRCRSSRCQVRCPWRSSCDDERNQVPFARPPGYDPADYELLLRTLQTGSMHVFGKFDRIPNRKTDTNNGPFSIDWIGGSAEYPEASYERRQEIREAHRHYQQGYFWFLCHDPRVPKAVRDSMSRWGLAADEFQEEGHWPPQIYVREARRMRRNFVMAEGNLRGLLPVAQPVGMGSDNMDSHHVRRVVVRMPGESDRVLNEGDVQVSPGGPYAIDYRALVPRCTECTNLLVPVCVSCTHTAGRRPGPHLTACASTTRCGSAELAVRSRARRCAGGASRRR